jgi:hypothetical protein
MLRGMMALIFDSKFNAHNYAMQCTDTVPLYDLFHMVTYARYEV